MTVVNAVLLTQVHEGYNVTCLVEIAPFVGNPHFAAGYRYSRCDIWQFLHVFIVIVAEEVCEEEVAVLVIIVDIYLKIHQLSTALRIYMLSFTLLLRYYCHDIQFAELKFRFQSEKCAASFNKCGIEGETDVTYIYRFYYLVFIAVVVEFQQLLVEIKGGFGVVVHRKAYFLTYFGVYIELYLFVEIRNGGFSKSLR